MLLTGKKVMIRYLHEKDLPQIKRWLNNHDLQWFTEEDFPVQWTEEMAVRLYNRAFKGRSEMYAVETLDGLLVGEVWLNPLSLENRYAEMVLNIDVPYQGKGYGKNAVELVLRRAFRQLDLHRVEIKVYSFNERALKLYTNCGFHEEGRLRERILRKGKYYDQIVMGILRAEYLELVERRKQDERT